MNVEGVDHEERTVELLEELEEYHSEDLLHLLDCEACQGGARERIGSPAGAPRMARPDYGVLLEELETRTPGLLKEMKEQDSEARALRSASATLSSCSRDCRAPLRWDERLIFRGHEGPDVPKGEVVWI